ncbi:MAG TPA: MOSC domain-containing protein, partial [Rubrobacter sp.]|nr:MOSC domain-containing protein [Rubrobacter sp.]
MSLKLPALRWIMLCMAPRTRLAPSTVTLSGLYVYPIKSCAGISLQESDLSATGLRHDRRWMLVDETGEFMSQRAHPRMALISVRFAPERLIVSTPDMDELEVSLYG